MKIIISHDVDHITAWEHWRDLVLPKSMVRSSIELTLSRISLAEYHLRFKGVVTNKFNNLEELMLFDEKNNVNSTFFIGVDRGLGLSYPIKKAECWIKKILAKGFEVGVHGIEYDNPINIKKEYDLFKQISGLNDFGIRMHYLRTSVNTVQYLMQTGYSFDSTIQKLDNPFRVGNLWEFPLHIMDVNLFNRGQRWQKQSLGQVKDQTLRILEKADEKGIRYFTLLFHDHYFGNTFEAWKNWYIWAIEYFKKNGYEFVTYRDAVMELEAGA